MYIVNILVRATLFMLAVLPGYLIYHGPIHVLLQPGILLGQGLLNIYCIVFFAGTINPKTEIERRRFYSAGLLGAVLSTVIPLAITTILVFGRLSEDLEIIGQTIASGIVTPIYALLIFVSFFKWADPDLADEDEVTKPGANGFLNSPSIRKLQNFFHIAFVTTGAITFFCITAGILAIIVSESVDSKEKTVEEDAKFLAQDRVIKEREALIGACLIEKGFDYQKRVKEETALELEHLKKIESERKR